MKITGVIRHWALAFVVPRPLIGIAYLPRYLLHWIRYRNLAPTLSMRWRDSYPCLGDWTSTTPFDAHYFYQGGWLARCVHRAAPKHHIDVGSSVLTMSVLSAFVDTTFIDVRPLAASLAGLDSKAGDILALPYADRSIESLSCLHVIEHIGLGRYNDALDPKGSVKAATELARVLTPGGHLYLSLPVGRARTCFNAHRVHGPSDVPAMFTGLHLLEFGYVDDDGNYYDRAQPSAAENLDYGCGLYHFEKPADAR